MAHITNDGLPAFMQDDPEAGVQVPPDASEKNKPAGNAVPREAIEATCIEGLRIIQYPRRRFFDLSGWKPEIHRLPKVTVR